MYKKILFISLIFSCVIFSCSKDDDSSSPSSSCNDGVQNGLETGIDCGGDCAACSTCFDGMQNGSETGVDCGGDCAPCLSSENEILRVSFEAATGGFNPVVTIDNTRQEVWIRIGKVFPTTDITNLSFDVELSPGASISNLPLDFSQPQIVEVVAEDGSARAYTCIVSGAYGTYRVVKSNGSEVNGETEGIYQIMEAKEQSGSVLLSLNANGGFSANAFRHGFDFELPNRTLGTSLVGSYSFIGGAGNTCSFSFSESTSSIEIFHTPSSGRLIISEHDLTNKLISGQLQDLNYNNAMTNEICYAYAEFINLRYE